MHRLGRFLFVCLILTLPVSSMASGTLLNSNKMVLLYYVMAGQEPPIDIWVDKAYGVDKPALKQTLLHDYEAVKHFDQQSSFQRQLELALYGYDSTLGEVVLDQAKVGFLDTPIKDVANVRVRAVNLAEFATWKITPEEFFHIRDENGHVRFSFSSVLSPVGTEMIDGEQVLNVKIHALDIYTKDRSRKIVSLGPN